MSLPEEEAFALRSANDFLLRLGSGEYMVESITRLRQEARRIMRHFPLDVAGRWMSISTVIQQAKAEQREEDARIVERIGYAPAELAATIRAAKGSVHDRDGMGICRKCGRGITGAEILDGESPAPQEAAMSEQDADVSDEVIATLWPDPETRPQRAKKCRRCGLIYTKGSHFLDCPERGWDYTRKAGDDD